MLRSIYLLSFLLLQSLFAFAGNVKESVPSSFDLYVCIGQSNMAGRATLTLGSDIDIHGTDMNPVFQTQRVGIKSFKADVPDGEYSVYLYWAELESDKEREALVYNLGADSEQTFAGNRSFGISINGTTVSDDFNVARDYGYARAVIKKFVITVKDRKGLSVDFHKKEGEPILNAIRIYRNY